jgi:hypothetical protein
MALERSEIPLHTNGFENEIRCQGTRRKVSAGTRSDLGRDCSDASKWVRHIIDQDINV